MQPIIVSFTFSYFGYQLAIASFYRHFNYMPNEGEIVHQLQCMVHDGGYYIGSICSDEVRKLAESDLIVEHCKRIFPELY